MYSPAQLQLARPGRVRISGALTATRPLHCGGGTVRTIPTQRDGEPRETEIAEVAALAGGIPCIPGSALKGVLSSWLRSAGDPSAAAAARDLFGSPEPGGEHGGAVQHLDAPLTGVAPGDVAFRLWDPVRGTLVEPAVSLDPVTRTAQDRKLFHLELCPPGTVFTVTLESPELDEDRLLHLLAALAAFQHPHKPIRLGANAGAGWGAMSWRLDSVESVSVAGIQEWLAGRMNGTPAAIPWQPRPAGEVVALRQKANELSARLHPAAGAHWRFHLDLQFLGAFLIQDPSQTRRREEDDVGDETQSAVSQATIRTRRNRPLLPGRTLRGALRGQSRRIWNTIAGRSVVPLDGAGDPAGLFPFFKLFGAPGWGAPIEVPDFTSSGNDTLLSKEFLAIDRFTGGAAQGRKFTADALYRPAFSGVISVDCERLRAAGAGPWALALLAFVLRDLCEGDIRLGAFSSRGFGECRATFRTLEYPAAAPEWDQVVRAIDGVDPALVGAASTLTALVAPGA